MNALALPGKGHPCTQGICFQPSAEGQALGSYHLLALISGVTRRKDIHLPEGAPCIQAEPTNSCQEGLCALLSHFGIFYPPNQGDSLYCSKSALGSLQGGWYFGHSKAKEKLLLPATTHSSFTNQFFFLNSQDKLSFNGTEKKKR